jgi:hypothetical protein
MYGIVSVELSRFAQTLGRFVPKESGDDPEVVKGQKIAVGSCSTCHNLGNAGGQMAGTPWAVLCRDCSVRLTLPRNFDFPCKCQCLSQGLVGQLLSN